MVSLPEESLKNLNFQISSHSETELIGRASSSNRDNNGKKTCEVERIILRSVVAAYVCLPCNYSFYGFLIYSVFVFVVRKLRLGVLVFVVRKLGPGLRSSFSYVLVFVTPASRQPPRPFLVPRLRRMFELPNWMFELTNWMFKSTNWMFESRIAELNLRIAELKVWIDQWNVWIDQLNVWIDQLNVWIDQLNVWIEWLRV